jgi:hypothetical protein
MLNLGVRGRSPLVAYLHVKEVFVLLIYVVLDSIQLVAGSVVSGGQCLGR